MPFIAIVSDEDASTDAVEIFEADRARFGFIPNHTRVFGHRPDVYRAWRQLIEAVIGNMDHRRYELATFAAASRLRSTYCALAHGAVLAERYLEPSAVRDLVAERHAAPIDEVDTAVMDLAEKVVDDATSVIPADIDRLRELGLTDAEILDVVLAAAVRCFFSKTLDALCVEADAKYRSLEPELRDALTVGRPIATS
jgi:uncharacterized peroxidase-related enzyme